jgi:hypothetical protein
MATTKENPANAGTAIISSFRYFKGLCFVTLSNGVSGIIGEASDMPLATMLTLKGQSISYKFIKKNGEYDQYSLGFAL